MIVSPGSARRIDPDAEAARLAEARKQAGEPFSCQHCAARPCPETPGIVLARSPAGGWECTDMIDCFGRQGMGEADHG
jgi:hypothetical protein